MYVKFIDSENIDRVMRDGTVMLSSFQYFRDLEKTRGPWIGDELEAAAELRAPKTLTLSEGSPDLAKVNQSLAATGLFKGKFAALSDGAKAELGGSRFITQISPMHIYCFSCGELDDLTKKMCVEANDRRDACLQIYDPATLMQAILDQGTTRENTPVRALFSKAEHGPVSYEPVSQSLLSGSAVEPSAFKKGLRFAGQNEYRFLFTPGQTQELPDQIIVRIPDPSRHFKEMFRDFRA